MLLTILFARSIRFNSFFISFYLSFNALFFTMLITRKWFDSITTNNFKLNNNFGNKLDSRKYWWLTQIYVYKHIDKEIDRNTTFSHTEIQTCVPVNSVFYTILHGDSEKRTNVGETGFRCGDIGTVLVWLLASHSFMSFSLSLSLSVFLVFFASDVLILVSMKTFP